MLPAFTSIFLLYGLGFGIQRLSPLNDITLSQLAQLVVRVMMPIYLFYTTAAQTELEAVRLAPVLIGLGILVTVGNFILGTLALKPLQVPEEQRPAFRFSMMWTNTLFLAAPICGYLFGPEGLVYAVLFDFGSSLVTLTLGIWTLHGGKFSYWQSLVFNPLIWSVIAGLAWASFNWSFPTWMAEPFELLGSATLPLALLVGGATIGGIRTAASASTRPLAGLTLARLGVAPFLVWMVIALAGWRGTIASVTIIEASMPVGLTASIIAQAYRADARFVASATLVSTVVSIFTAPLLAILISFWFRP